MKLNIPVDLSKVNSFTTDEKLVLLETDLNIFLKTFHFSEDLFSEDLVKYMVKIFEISERY
mgnify:CR=1 FL=1